jgi:hypothetical protein
MPKASFRNAAVAVFRPSRANCARKITGKAARGAGTLAIS